MEAPEPSKEPSLLERVRNMWEFANLVQWIFIFGRAVKIDENLDIEVGLVTFYILSLTSLFTGSYTDTATSRISKWNASSPIQPSSLRLALRSSNLCHPTEA